MGGFQGRYSTEGLVFLLVLSTVSIVSASDSVELCTACDCSFTTVWNSIPETTTDFGSWRPIHAVAHPSGKHLLVNCSRGRFSPEWPPIDIRGALLVADAVSLPTIPPLPDSVKQLISSLSLARNRISRLDAGDFDEYRELRYLDLSGNELRQLPDFCLSRTRKLLRLDLSKNEIERLGTLSTDSPLVYLDLSRNRLSIIDGETIRGLGKLAYLDLSGNHLSRLPENFGSSLPNLRILRAAGNRMEEMPRLSRSLRVVDVGSNGLRTLTLPQMDGLTELVVSNNKLYDLDNVYEQYALKVLRADHNNLSRLGEWKNSELRVLDLRYNEFESIPREINWERLPHLQELYLDGNPIVRLTTDDDDGRKAFPDLDVLGLSHMANVTAIQKESLKGLIVQSQVNCSEEHGVFLNLSGNQLRTIDDDTFHNYPICSIDLSHNRLSFVPANLFNWQNLTSANLQNNPWNCICDLQWILDDFVPHFYLSQPQLLLDLRCNAPSRIKDKHLVYWYKARGRVFCDGPTYYRYEYSEGKYFEIWTVSMIVCVVLSALIVILIIAIVVLAFIKPKTARNGNKERQQKKRSKAYLSQFRIKPDRKYDAIGQGV